MIGVECINGVRNGNFYDITSCSLFGTGKESICRTAIGDGFFVFIVDTALNVVSLIRSALVVVFIKENFYGILLIGVGTCHTQYGVGDFGQHIEVIFIPEHLGNSGCSVAHGVGVDINGVGICPCGIDIPVNGDRCIGLGCLGILGLFCQCDDAAGGQCTAINRSTFIHHVKKAFC